MRRLVRGRFADGRALLMGGAGAALRSSIDVLYLPLEP